MDRVVSIWLDANLQAHSFIPSEYWKNNLEYVREALPLAEVHVYEDAQGVQGFIGLDGDHIEGLFVAKEMRSHGIGKQLMDHVKQGRVALTLKRTGRMPAQCASTSGKDSQSKAKIWTFPPAKWNTRCNGGADRPDSHDKLVIRFREIMDETLAPHPKSGKCRTTFRISDT